MPLFMCRKCGCAENTALGEFWGCDPETQQCSECETGQWHDQFPKRSAEGMLVDQNGFLWQVAENLPKHYQIVGAILSPIDAAHEESK